MKIVIIGQEEPIYFGPFFRKIIEAKSSEIVLITLVGNRGIGSHPKTFWAKLKNIYCLWRLFEPSGFFKTLRITCYQKIISFLRLTGTRYDKRSIQGIALEKNIPLLFVDKLHSPKFYHTLKEYDPDIIINQSEQIIQKELLSIPKIGILNRHASLLPHFRGRVGSFWAHAEKSPEYGVTIHFVDEKIDSGPIVLQKKYALDPSLSYTSILDALFQLSVPLMLEALKKLENPSFSLLPNNYNTTTPYKFPSLKKIQDYRKTLKQRRQRKNIQFS